MSNKTHQVTLTCSLLLPHSLQVTLTFCEAPCSLCRSHQPSVCRPSASTSHTNLLFVTLQPLHVTPTFCLSPFSQYKSHQPSVCRPSASTSHTNLLFVTLQPLLVTNILDALQPLLVTVSICLAPCSQYRSHEPSVCHPSATTSHTNLLFVALQPVQVTPTFCLSPFSQYKSHQPSVCHPSATTGH